MRRKAALFIIFCLGIAWPSTAQTLPLPSTLLDDSVTLIQAHPAVDNINRALSVYRDGAWITLPYPEQLTGIYAAQYETFGPVMPVIAQRADGAYIFLEQDTSTYQLRPWLADFEAQRIYPVDPPCHLQIYSIGNPWVYVTLGVETFLCNWITGEVSPPLPERLAWSSTVYGRNQPELSPDGRYLVLSGYFSEEPDTDAGMIYGERFYSYNTRTRAFTSLGEIFGFDDVTDFPDWLSPTHFVYARSEMPEWSIRNRYVGDVTQADSLHFALSMLRFGPSPVLAPPGLQIMYAEMEDGYTPGPCFIRFYDAITRQTTEYDTGSLCEFGIAIPDGSGDQLFRAVYPAAAVVRYNFRNGARRNLFVGEVERLGEIAPDGRLGLIGLEDSGIVDTDQDVDLNFGVEVDPSVSIVMDLQTGQIYGAVAASASWLTSSVLYGHDRYYTIDSDGVSESELPGMLLETLPSREQFVFSDGAAITLFTPSDGSTQTIAHIPDGYRVQVRRLSEDTLQIMYYWGENGLATFALDVPLP